MSTKEILFNTRFNILHSIYFFLRIILAIGDLDDLRVFVWDAGTASTHSRDVKLFSSCLSLAFASDNISKYLILMAEHASAAAAEQLTVLSSREINAEM